MCGLKVEIKTQDQTYPLVYSNLTTGDVVEAKHGKHRYLVVKENIHANIEREYYGIRLVNLDGFTMATMDAAKEGRYRYVTSAEMKVEV